MLHTDGVLLGKYDIINKINKEKVGGIVGIGPTQFSGKALFMDSGVLCYVALFCTSGRCVCDRPYSTTKFA